MIKIQEHLNRADAENYLDTLAEELWTELNPKIKDGTRYKVVSLVEKCKKYAADCSTVAYRNEYANKDVATAARHKAFFDFLNANDAEELKNLIVSRPNQFAALKTNILLRINQADLFTGTPGNYSQTTFGKLLSENLFDYTKFRGSDFCKELFVSLGFSTASCPYCNDNKLNITKLKSNSSLATKINAYLDLDHFYPKSQHPYFAVSFFNLIPTCHDCNSHDKRDKQFTIQTHIHPYHEAFDDFYHFKISLVALLGNPVDSIEIESKNLKALDITVTDLNLDARYANSFEEANKLIDLFWKNKSHIGGEFETSFKELILRTIPREKKDILKFQRAKMSRDILKQVDVHNILSIT